MILQEQNTKGQSAWTIHGRGIPCMKCVFHTGYPAHGNQEEEADTIKQVVHAIVQVVHASAGGVRLYRWSTLWRVVH